MKRLQFVLFIAISVSAVVSAETTVSAGGGLTYDSDSSYPISPEIDATLLGDLSWIPTDRIGAFLDWSGAGSYQPFGGISSALLAATADGSYMADKFLARVSISSLASISTVDPLYGAASTELLLSYGGPERSLFAAPLVSLVEDGDITVHVGGKVGGAFLLFDSFLLKPVAEAGIEVPGGIGEGWYVSPSLSLDWYPGGRFTLSLDAGYRKSYSTRLSSLVAGGPLLPVDTFDRLFLKTELSFLIGKGMTLTARLPCSYTLKAYDAVDGGIDLGVPAWLVDIQPEIDLTLPVRDRVDLVLSGSGSFGLSNNAVERVTALSTTARFELHFD